MGHSLIWDLYLEERDYQKYMLVFWLSKSPNTVKLSFTFRENATPHLLSTNKILVKIWIFLLTLWTFTKFILFFSLGIQRGTRSCQWCPSKLVIKGVLWKSEHYHQKLLILLLHGPESHVLHSNITEKQLWKKIGHLPVLND